MNLPRNGLVGRAVERLEEATGQSLVNSEKLGLLEQVYDDHRLLQRELEDIGWTVLDYVSGQPTEQKREDRMKVVQRARYVWMHDPMAGAAVELMNDFVFGRGVPHPRCKDKRVQEAVDRAWSDADNFEVLTSYEAQLALGVDLALQSNVFMLMFDQGEDGRVKLATLRHDDVRDVIPDPEKRHRLMWYVAFHAQQRWDFKTGRWGIVPQLDPMKVTYYPHWRNVDLAIEEQANGERQQPEMPPDDRLGDGKVYHVRINRYSEQKFGVPRFQRTLRWYCYSDDTETLTSEGWLGLEELKRRDADGTLPLIAGFDTTREQIVYEKPLAPLHVFPYVGSMAHFKARGFDMLVTPNHRMVGQEYRVAGTHLRLDPVRQQVRGATEKWAFVEAQDVRSRMLLSAIAAPWEGGTRVEEFSLPGSRAVSATDARVAAALDAASVSGRRYVPGRRGGGVPAGTLQGHREDFRVPMDAWLTFLGWWVAEGYGAAEVCQSVKSPHLATIQAAVDALGIPGRELNDGRMWRWRPTYLHAQIGAWLRANCGVAAREKRLPEFVFGLAREQQQLLLAALMAGDGQDRWARTGQGWYATASEGLADDVQRLALLCGHPARKVRLLIRGRDHWRVHLAKRTLIGLPAPDWQDWAGEVYCFEMPCGTMVTRRNGFAAFHAQTAYNSFVKARIDLAEASAKLIMKRKLKGTPQALARQVTQALSRTSPLGVSEDPLGRPLMPSPPNAAVLEENESVDHQSFRLDTGSANAQQDAQQIRAPISAAERWTQAYFGDASQSSLATATSLELPILKMVEARQEVFEAIFRWFIDRVIERAVEIGEIAPILDAEELAELRAKKEAAQPQPAPMPPTQEMVAQAVADEQQQGRRILEVTEVICGEETLPLLITRDEQERTFFRMVPDEVREDYEDQGDDEEEVMRDLGYDLSLPSPLRRMMTDLVSAVSQIATTFDPNGTNVELSRTLLAIALGEGLEVQDPADVVEKIFPPGFDPMAAMRPPVAGPGQDAGQAFPSGPDANAYGAPMNAQQPGQNGNAAYYSQQAQVEEAFKKLPDPQRKPLEGHRDEVAERFDREVASDLLDELDRVTVVGE